MPVWVESLRIQIGRFVPLSDQQVQDAFAVAAMVRGRRGETGGLA